MTPTTLRPDLCIIGASEAGRAVAMGAAAMGCAVVVIDDGDPSGRRNPDLVLEVLRAGARAGEDPQAVLARLDARLSRAAPDRSHARLAAMNIRVVPATGRFRDPDTVEVDGVSVKARRFVIATGRVRPGRDRLTIANLAQAVPDRLAVLGGGSDALSVAQSLGRFGTAVMLVTETVLPGIDPELSAPLHGALARSGVAIAATLPPGWPALVADSGAPALDGLDGAGIAHHGEAMVLTPALRTANRRVFAIGFPAGATSSAAGVAQAGVVLRAALFRLPVRDRPDRVPIVIATDPEIAQVGLTEAAARERGNIQVWRWPLAHTGAADGASGHLKVVTDVGGRVLGAGVVGDGAREQIGLWALALTRRLTLGDLADVAMPVPSCSEAVRAVALSHTAQRLRSPWVGRALGLMGRLG